MIQYLVKAVFLCGCIYNLQKIWKLMWGQVQGYRKRWTVFETAIT